MSFRDFNILNDPLKTVNYYDISYSCSKLKYMCFKSLLLINKANVFNCFYTIVNKRLQTIDKL